MIGRINRITKFGLFISLTNGTGFDKTIKKGLLRWSNFPKGLPKLQIGDLITVEIETVHEDGKIDLIYIEKEFKSTYGAFLEASAREIEHLQIENKEFL